MLPLAFSRKISEAGMSWPGPGSKGDRPRVPLSIEETTTLLELHGVQHERPCRTGMNHQLGDWPPVVRLQVQLLCGGAEIVAGRSQQRSVVIRAHRDEVARRVPAV